jgi:predicted enzyme related to lactoylglutathione lyase
MLPPNARPVVHLELHTPDGRSAGDFYAELCRWQAELVEAPGAHPYRALEMGRGLGGGIVECGASKPLWLPYVEVADIESATDQARRLGARTLLTPREGPAGWRSVVSTPASGEIALWQQKR